MHVCYVMRAITACSRSYVLCDTIWWSLTHDASIAKRWLRVCTVAVSSRWGEKAGSALPYSERSTCIHHRSSSAYRACSAATAGTSSWPRVRAQTMLSARVVFDKSNHIVYNDYIRKNTRQYMQEMCARWIVGCMLANECVLSIQYTYTQCSRGRHASYPQ